METIEYVYFNPIYEKAAPELFGLLALNPGCVWVKIPHLTAAVERGAHVTVRQLSESETKRCDQIIALRGIGDELAKRIAAVLDDRNNPDAAPAAYAPGTPAHGNYPTANLLDKEVCK